MNEPQGSAHGAACAALTAAAHLARDAALTVRVLVPPDPDTVACALAAAEQAAVDTVTSTSGAYMRVHFLARHQDRRQHAPDVAALGVAEAGDLERGTLSPPVAMGTRKKAPPGRRSTD